MSFVLRELDIAQEGQEKHRIMLFPIIVRNSLHANGILTRDESGGKIANINFSFKKGVLAIGNWRVIYFFFDKIIDVIKEIFEKDEIKENIYITHFAENSMEP